jgi:hypothetical protein
MNLFDSMPSLKIFWLDAHISYYYFGEEEEGWSTKQMHLLHQILGRTFPALDELRVITLGVNLGVIIDFVERHANLKVLDLFECALTLSPEPHYQMSE